MSYSSNSNSTRNSSYNSNNRSPAPTSIETIASTPSANAQNYQTRANDFTEHTNVSPSALEQNTWGVPPTHSPTDSELLATAFDSLRVAQMEQEEKPGKEENRSSPSASSSQGDMADNEMEAGPSQPAEETRPPPPPKKKRTRTLTTPHQAAVLHALLAQSRFPTTAMREEVGRSIGLSARKVQIWFQNQRQKARRPRGQNAPPLTRPPQFGPFPNVPSGSTAGEPSTSAGLSTLQAEPSLESPAATRAAGDSPPFRTPISASSSAGSEFFSQHEPQVPIQLSGPGVPGPSTEPPTSFPIRRASYAAPRSRRESTRQSAGHPGFHPYSHTGTRPATAGEALETHRSTPRPTRSLLPARRLMMEEEFNITLPPLRLDRAPSPHGQSRQGTIHSLPSLTGHRHSHPSLQSESPFAHEPLPRIPPPFTLQPTPMWDDPAFSPFNRPGSTSRPPSSYDLPPRSPAYYHPYPEYRHSLEPRGGLGRPLPPLSPLSIPRLSESTAGPSHFTPTPTRTRFDPVHPSAPSGESALPGPSSSRSPSRPHVDDTFETHDVHR